MKKSANTRTAGVAATSVPAGYKQKRGLASRLQSSEHAVSIGALRGRDFFLQNIPMFRDLISTPTIGFGPHPT
jgi:hypothetical protein